MIKVAWCAGLRLGDGLSHQQLSRRVDTRLQSMLSYMTDD